MTSKQARTEHLLHELENLHQLLDHSTQELIPTLEDQETGRIPLLNDRITIGEKTSQAADTHPPMSPAGKEQIEKTIDELVASYMPRIEQELRHRLHSLFEQPVRQEKTEPET